MIIYLSFSVGKIKIRSVFIAIDNQEYSIQASKTQS